MSELASDMIRETLLYSGQVQGVGFRHTTATLARNYAVAGYVQNLSDGRVRLVAEGAADEVQAFVDDLQETMTSYIQGVDSHLSVGTGEYGRPGPDGAFRIKL